MTDTPLATDSELAAGLLGATERLATVADTHPDAEVPTCPGWTVGRVAIHTGRIHRWVAAALAAPTGTDVPPAPRPPPDVDLGTWVSEGASLLTAALDAAGPHGATTAPGWERPASWWRRRTCHETTVHAWDVEAAVGAPAAIDPKLATDGIAEVVEVLLPGAVDLDAFGPPATIHLHTTDDRDGEWLITVTPEGISSERRHAKGDVAVRGPAGDLLLWVWGRGPTSALDVVGDASVATRLVAATNL